MDFNRTFDSLMVNVNIKREFDFSFKTQIGAKN